MELLCSRDPWWMTECDAALLAEGVPHRWLAHARLSDGSILEIPECMSDRAVVILSALLGEGLERQQAAAAPTQEASVPWLWRPAVATGLGMAACTVVFYGVTGSSAAAGPWQVRGALLADSVMLDHTWWRLVTAATLHADSPHALGNAGFFVALAWAAGERLGSGIMLLAWLITAVAGFIVSLLTSSATLTVGASGGLYGLLGAAGGHALLGAALYHEPGRRRMQVVGAAIMLLAFTAFSPHANWQAHVGGFAAGALVGMVAAVLPRPGAWGQALAATICAAGVAAAWLRAWA